MCRNAAVDSTFPGNPQANQANTPASNTIPLKLADLPDALYSKILALSKAD